MSPSSLIKLVSSLSSSEKRYFKLQSKIQSGSKEYLLLFDLIEQFKNCDPSKLKTEFKKKSTGSWENTCIYLGDQLVDSLARSKSGKDIFFELLQQLQKAKILKARSLDEEALRQVKKVQQKAAQYQLHWIEYYCFRYELNHYSENNFPDIHDDHLVKLQMKGKEVLRSLNSIHDHYSLFEVLKYRLVHAGKAVSEEGRKKMNDLMLSEMVLVAGKSKSFTSQKLHLLFQSFFFTHIGDYSSALKSFYELNGLMEKNELYLDNPPLDYWSALNGILDSLRSLGNKTEVNFYLNKIKRLDHALYPEYFRYLVRKSFYTQQILVLLQSGEYESARGIVSSIPSDVFTSYALVDEEKQCELYFYCSLVHFYLSDWRKAHLFLTQVMNQLKLPQHLLITKAIRLLNIIIYFEKGEMLHLEYEIRSYKRFFAQAKLLKTEKFAFKVITSTSATRRLRLMNNEQKRILNELELIAKDRYEQQLLRYFDFAEWIRAIVEGRKQKQNLPSFS